MEILAQFPVDTIDHSKEQTSHLVLTLKAPTLDWIKKRPSLCVVPLIDLSGSMSGAKLEGAKESLLKLVDQLQPGDITGLVGFESRSHVIVKPQEVTAKLKESLKREIRKLRHLGGTNFSDGLMDSINLVKSLDLGPQFLKRIILFTDGQPTEGITDQGEIIKLLKENAGSITVSAFGYGSGDGVWNGCDQEFLLKFSQEGKGNYAYVQGPDDTLTAFARELGGLLSTYAQDIHICVQPANEHRISKVVTDIAHEFDLTNEVDFQIPDILSEEIRHFVLEVLFQPQDKTGVRPVNVFNVSVSYSILTEGGKRERRTVEARARIQFVPSGEEQKQPNKELDEIISLAQVIRAQLDAEEQAKAGNYVEAQEIMKQVAESVTSRGNHGTGRLANAIQSRLAFDKYRVSAGYLRSLSVGATRGYGLASIDHDAVADLADASSSIAFYNSAQKETSYSFGADPNAWSAKEDMSASDGRKHGNLGAVEPLIVLPKEGKSD